MPDKKWFFLPIILSIIGAFLGWRYINSAANLKWNDLPTWQKRGYCVLRNTGSDSEIPIFTQDREYIEQHLAVEDD